MKSRARIQVALAGAALLVIAGLTLWLVLGGERASPVVPAAPGGGGVTVPSEERPAELASAPQAPALDPSKPSVERTVAEKDPRDVAVVIDDSELASAIWIEGRVELAADTPADEDAWVVAKGRDFERRPLHRARVGPDGRFKVAFEKSTRTGWLALSARYGYLAKDEAIRLSKPPKDIVLKGLLGGCVHGRILLSISAQERAPDVARGRVRAGIRRFELFDGSQVEGRILPELRYEVGGVVPGVDRHVSLVARGFLTLDVGEVLIEAGKMTARDLAPEVGTSIQGRVTTADGAPVADAVVSVASSEDAPDFAHAVFGPDAVRSSKDGAFEMVGLRGGELTLVVQKAGFAPLHLAMGDVPLGSRKTGVLAVMSEGQSISGRVQFAEDKPVAGALVHDAEEGVEERIGEQFGVQMEPPTVVTETSARFVPRDGARADSATVSARFSVDPDGSPSCPRPTRTKRCPIRRSACASAARRGPRRRSASRSARAISCSRSRRATRSAGACSKPQGKPVERFTVRAHPDESSAGCVGKVDPLERSFKAADGRFELDGLKPCTWSVSVTAKGLLDSVHRTVQMPDPRASSSSGCCASRGSPASWSGPDGRPVPGAEVACRSAGEGAAIVTPGRPTRAPTRRAPSRSAPNRSGPSSSSRARRTWRAARSCASISERTRCSRT